MNLYCTERHILRLIILSLFGFISVLNAQNYCGTSTQTQYIKIEEHLSAPNFPKDNFEVQNLPMQVHIVLTDNGGADFSMQKLKESICTLNNDFIPTGFQFYMEKPVNYIRNSKYNEHNYDDGEKMMLEYNVPNVINVYIVSSPAGNCGYYTYSADAVALSKSCTSKSSHTWAHEFGHYFSLPHTFLGWEGIDYRGGSPASEYQKDVRGQIENIDRSGCGSKADNFCDTPPDYISNRWGCTNSDSSLITQVDLNGESFKSDGSLFMSYSLDNCSSRFSNEQMSAMQSFLTTRRSNLKRTIELNEIAEFDNTSLFPGDSAVTKSKVTFAWKEIPNATSYIFQLSRNHVFTVLIRNVEIKTNAIEVDSLLQDKRYYWRVIPLSNEYFCNEMSKSSTLIIDNLLAIKNTNKESVEVYPSQISQGQSIFIHSKKMINKLRLLNTSGTDVSNNMIVRNAYSTVSEISTQNLPIGFYFLFVDEQIFKISIY
ncbi:MAG: hypothetical protein HOP11_12810 [Saprospiraceae bacterium]|nr:hypothetical protein [Saprospiraceae bacterium]